MKTYIYPTYTPSRDKSGNLYIKYFHDSFSKDESFDVVNRAWQIGISSLFFNLDAKLFIIQWIDLIPYKKLGKVQFMFFLLGILLLKCLKKKILWVLHNKESHKGKSHFVDFGMKFLSMYADYVVTHSEEGVRFFHEKYPYSKSKVVYIPHPVYENNIYHSEEIRWDYVIWGNISSRKNIREFLVAANNNNFWKSKRILIIGRCSSVAYDVELKQLLTPNVEYINKFVSKEDLAYYISHSNIILFTYNEQSVLSSGALVYSLNYMKPIVGPNVGSFADLKGIVSCYNTFDDIVNLPLDYDEQIAVDYIKNNTWNNFPQKILSLFTGVV